MNKKIFPLSIAFLLFSCAGNEIISSSIFSSSSSSEDNSFTSSKEESSSDIYIPSSGDISSIESSSSKEPPIEESSSNEESSNKEESSSQSFSNVSTSGEVVIPDVSGTNPDGSPRINVPTNYLDPYDYSSSYFNFDVSEYSYSSSLAGGFSLIYGNSKYDKPGASKYEYNEDNPDVNGLKMDYYDKNYTGRSYVGLQSPCLVSNKKIEFRFKVSGSHGTQRKNAKKDKTLFTIYSFSRDAKLIRTDEYSDSSYCKTILNNGEVKLYITPAEEVSYFEFRLNQAPYSSNQEFNFNISRLTIRQWEYE